MNISKRLRVIGDLIPNNSFILDIGCDHALLDIYVVSKNKNIKAIASDLRSGPLKLARENIKKYNLEKEIKLVQGNGLEAYEKCVDTVVMSGLGTSTIIEILEKRKEVLKEIKRLVISSNNDCYMLRKTISKLGFRIKEEQVVIDKNKYYPIIVFEKGYAKYNFYELKYGPFILKSKNKNEIDYLLHQREKLVKIKKSLGRKYFLKRIKITREISYLQKNKKNVKKCKKSIDRYCF